jgi:protein-S-isoprenylcysteine O-methyltransferase Ste14
MRKKHITIEILPRVLWVVEGAALLLAHYFTNQSPTLTENPVALIVGILLTVLGIIYVIWTFRFIAKAMFNKSLVTSGPYKYARHPMYVAIYMILVGIGILFFGQLWLIILAVFLPLWYFDCKLEEQQMIDLHGEKYLEYKKKVGMFFPHKL